MTKTFCQFSCEHTCTLVGHAHEAIRFLNQCMEHGIVKTAVEQDPQFKALLEQMKLTTELLYQRTLTCLR